MELPSGFDWDLDVLEDPCTDLPGLNTSPPSVNGGLSSGSGSWDPLSALPLTGPALPEEPVSFDLHRVSTPAEHLQDVMQQAEQSMLQFDPRGCSPPRQPQRPSSAPQREWSGQAESQQVQQQRQQEGPHLGHLSQIGRLQEQLPAIALKDSCYGCLPELGLQLVPGPTPGFVSASTSAAQQGQQAASAEASERTQLLLRYWHLVQRRQQLLAAEGARVGAGAGAGAGAVTSAGVAAASAGSSDGCFRRVRFDGAPTVRPPWAAPAIPSPANDSPGSVRRTLPWLKRSWADLQAPRPAPAPGLVQPHSPAFGILPSGSGSLAVALPSDTKVPLVPSGSGWVPESCSYGPEAKHARPDPEQVPALGERVQAQVLYMAREAVQLRAEVKRLQRVLCQWSRQGYVTLEQALEYLGSLPV